MTTNLDIALINDNQSALLVDGEILEEIEKGHIIIKPFNRESLGTNSYDVHLGKTLAKYDDYLLDSKRHNPITYFEIPDEGFVLLPGRLYLGVTQEYTETHKYVPILEGKSSVGRLGIQMHLTAGKGDISFANHWTLEIICAQPVRIYAGMPIGQIMYFRTNFEKIQRPYNKKPNAKYNQVSDLPKESMMFKNFSEDDQKKYPNTDISRREIIQEDIKKRADAYGDHSNI